MKRMPYRQTTSINNFRYQKWTVKGNTDSANWIAFMAMANNKIDHILVGEA